VRLKRDQELRQQIDAALKRLEQTPSSPGQPNPDEAREADENADH
jgi:hypothetical protein